MFRLKVKQGKRWKTGIVTYGTYIEAQTRQIELEIFGIQSKIVDNLGGAIN